MNRREMLMTAAGGIGAISPAMAFAHFEESTFKPIEKRLSGRIEIFDLEDLESGYIGKSNISFDINGIPYLNITKTYAKVFNKELNGSYYPPFTSAERPSENESQYLKNNFLFIGRMKNNFYIEINELLPTDKYQPFIVLAHHSSYPLQVKEGNYYVVPCNLEERQSNLLVKRNTEKLKKFNENMKVIIEEFDIKDNNTFYNFFTANIK